MHFPCHTHHLLIHSLSHDSHFFVVIKTHSEVHAQHHMMHVQFPDEHTCCVCILAMHLPSCVKIDIFEHACVFLLHIVINISSNALNVLYVHYTTSHVL
jgi:hypothetical protein